MASYEATTPRIGMKHSEMPTAPLAFRVSYLLTQQHQGLNLRYVTVPHTIHHLMSLL